mgnify:CR=1 FL=1
MVNGNGKKAEETEVAANNLVGDTRSDTNTRGGSCPNGLVEAEEQFASKLRSSEGGTAVAVPGPAHGTIVKPVVPVAAHGACPAGLVHAQEQFESKLRPTTAGTAVAVRGPARAKVAVGMIVDDTTVPPPVPADLLSMEKVAFGTIVSGQDLDAAAEAPPGDNYHIEEQLDQLEQKIQIHSGKLHADSGDSPFNADGIQDLPSTTSEAPREPVVPGAISVGGTRQPDPQEPVHSQTDSETEEPATNPPPDSISMLSEEDQRLGMVQARPVEEDTNIVEADPVSPEDQRRSLRRAAKGSTEKSYTAPLILLGVAVLAIIVGVVIGVVLRETQAKEIEGQGGVANTTSRPSPSPAPAGCSYTNVSILDLPEVTLKQAICAPESPQYQAYLWLLQDPYIARYPSWRRNQRFALATFYFATGGDAWTLNDNWLKYDSDECKDWFFRPGGPLTQQPWTERRYLRKLQETTAEGNATSACDQNGRYQVISLSKNNMVGHIPPEIGLLLPQLQYLDLSAQEQLAGSIPSELGLLTHLKRLSLHRNFHTGTIPFELTLLTDHIEEIFLGYNPNIEGTIPTEVGNLHSTLRALSFRRSGVTGYVPTEIFRLTNLRELYLQNCLGITGGTLEGIGALSHLQRFAAHDVPYASTIPSEIGLLTDMRALNFWNTRMKGTLPSEFFRLTNIVRLDIDDNFLSGTFPAGLGAFSHLEVFWMNGNRWSGTFPADLFQHWKNLTLWKTENNLMSGTLPTEIGLMENLKEVWFANLTRLSGTIPSELGQLKQLEGLFLHYNAELTGTIPSELAALQNFSTFSLSNTSITGSIPEALCDDLKDMELTCSSMLGIPDQICINLELRNFSCDYSLLCGCSCEPCT